MNWKSSSATTNTGRPSLEAQSSTFTVSQQSWPKETKAAGRQIRALLLKDGAVRESQLFLPDIHAPPPERNPLLPPKLWQQSSTLHKTPSLIHFSQELFASINWFPCCCSVHQSCLIVCNPMDCSPPGSSVHEISPGKNTGVSGHYLLQGIFPTQRLNPCLLVSCVGGRCFTVEPPGKPRFPCQITDWVCVPAATTLAA